MGKKRKNFRPGTFKSGTWITQDLYFSKAFHDLKGFAPQLLILFLAKRDIDNEHKCTNEDSITMTYIELENIYNRGQENRHLPKSDGIRRPRIIRAIDELLAKGFIKIISRGGAYKQDKSVYGLSDQWRWWSSGVVFNTRTKEPRRGYQGRKLGATASPKCNKCGTPLDEHESEIGECEACLFGVENKSNARNRYPYTRTEPLPIKEVLG